MAELTDILGSNLFERKVHLHTINDAGATLQLDSGVEVTYPCDPSGGFERKSNGDLWDNTNGLFSPGEGAVVDSRLDVKWSFTINVGNAQSITLNIVIPDAGGDIPVYSKTYVLASGDNDLSNSTIFYNGPEALVAKFKLTLTPSVNMDIKARSLLVIA
jgi:hypothetical protein